jgi:hypothetical protein
MCVCRFSASPHTFFIRAAFLFEPIFLKQDATLRGVSKSYLKYLMEEFINNTFRKNSTTILQPPQMQLETARSKMHTPKKSCADLCVDTTVDKQNALQY